MSENNIDNENINNKEEGINEFEDNNHYLNNNEKNFEIDNSNDILQNNLIHSDNGQNQEEEEMDHNLINYEINNEDEIYQNNINIESSNNFNNNDDNDNNIISFNENSNNEINNNINSQDILNNENNEEGEEYNNIENGEENEQDDEITLITLNAICVCQCCNNNFNNNENLPFLFKCGHFFCLKCINQYFKKEVGITCPSDGLIAKSIKELKFLKNLIVNNNNDNEETENNNIEITENNTLSLSMNKKNNSIIIEDNIKDNKKINKNKYCLIHKDQKLTHINCDENKLICIYCAFESIKNEPKCEIKEIKEKVEEYKKNVNTIIDNTNNNLEKIKDCLKKFKKSKEEKAELIKSFYKKLIEFLNNKKNEEINKCNIIYDKNIKEIEKNIKTFNEIIEKGNECLKLINNSKKDEYIIFNIIENYKKLYNLCVSKNNVDRFEYTDFKGFNINEIINYLNNISGIEIKNEFLNYIPYDITNNYLNSNNMKDDNIRFNFSNFNFFEKINEYPLKNILNKYTFPKGNQKISKLDLYSKNNISTSDSIKNENYVDDFKYKTISFNNIVNNNQFINQDMPIHNSYLFHRNAFKNNNYLSDKKKNDLYDKYNNCDKTMDNLYKNSKTDFTCLHKNKNNNYNITNHSYFSLTKSTFPYNFNFNKKSNI